MKTYNFSEITKLFFCGGVTESDNSILKKLQDGFTNGIEATVHPKELERQERLSKRRSKRNGGITASATITSPKVYFTRGNGRYDNAVIIASGGFGFGTKDDSFFTEMLSKVNKLCELNKSHLLFVRGSNDDPSYFTEDKFGLSNVKFLEDYSIVKMNGFDCLCVGGSLPIDRQWRIEQGKRLNKKLYFENSTSNFDQEAIESIIRDNKVACIITSDAPTFVPPYIDDSTSSKWATSDETIISDITSQRLVMDKIYLEMIKADKKPYIWCFASNSDNVTSINNIRFMASTSPYTMFDLQSSCEDTFDVGLNGEKRKKELKKIQLKKMTTASNIGRGYAVDEDPIDWAAAPRFEEPQRFEFDPGQALGEVNHPVNGRNAYADAAEQLDAMLREYRGNADAVNENVGVGHQVPDIEIPDYVANEPMAVGRLRQGR